LEKSFLVTANRLRPCSTPLPSLPCPADPRWGRNQEVPSESPLINGAFGTGYTLGAQTGDDARFLKTAVTMKHWAAYSLENSDGFTRHTFNAVVSNYSLAMTYFPHFKRTVQEGGVAGFMCSYNSLNGVPTCASPFLRRVLREAWGYNGYVTSDSGAIEDIWQPAKSGHAYRNATPEQAACYAIRDGQTDVCSGSTYHDHLLSAVANGVCARADVDLALSHTLQLRMRLGLFEPAIDDQPYWHVGLEAVNTTASQAEAWLTTLESLVLLKHDGATLPLAPGKAVAVIGPHWNATNALAGNYLGQLCPKRIGEKDTTDCIESPVDAIAAANTGGSTQGARGCGVSGDDRSGFPAALALAAGADVIVLALGIDLSVEGESNDRTAIDLPPVQHALVAAVVAAARPGARIVAFLLNGGPLDITPELATPALGAILSAGYPGVRGARAIAATLYGQNDHLGGKLAYTVYNAAYVNEIEVSGRCARRAPRSLHASLAVVRRAGAQCSPFLPVVSIAVVKQTATT